MLHWNLCKKYHLLASEKWRERNVEKILQNEVAEIYYDYKIQTDIHLTHNIPDITATHVVIIADLLVNASHVCKLQFNCRRIHMNITVLFYIL